MIKYKNRKCKKIRYKKRKNKMTKNKQETQEIETEKDAQSPADASTDAESSQEDKLSCTISWLVRFSLLFILTIVVGLFDRIAIRHLSEEPFKTILRFSSYIFPLIIAFLSGLIVYQKDKEKKQKQRDMAYDIEDALKKLYKEGQ